MVVGVVRHVGNQCPDIALICIKLYLKIVNVTHVNAECIIQCQHLIAALNALEARV